MKFWAAEKSAAFFCKKNGKEDFIVTLSKSEENRLFWRIQSGKVRMSVFAQDEETWQKFSAIACNAEDDGFTVRLVNDENHCFQKVFIDYELIDSIKQLSLLVAAFADPEHNIRIWFFDSEDPDENFICDILWSEDGKRFARIQSMPKIKFAVVAEKKDAPGML